jgi:hypothetical protein
MMWSSVSEHTVLEDDLLEEDLISLTSPPLHHVLNAASTSATSKRAAKLKGALDGDFAEDSSDREADLDSVTPLSPVPALTGDPKGKSQQPLPWENVRRTKSSSQAPETLPGTPLSGD